MSKQTRKVVALADLHAGHVGAVTPPDWWKPAKPRDPKLRQIADAQREIWAAFTEEVKMNGHPDLLIVNGDLVDGVGRATGGTELITTDIETQCRIATEVILAWDPKAVVCTYGTPYHTSLEGQDVERIVVQLLRREGVPVKLDSHAFFQVNGVKFDVRHYGGRSSVPTTRTTPLNKEWLSNLLWSIREEQPQADVILRAHIHQFAVTGGCRPDWLGFFQPALLAAMTIYGARKCSNPVDWGYLTFEITPDGDLTWRLHTRKLQCNTRQAVLLEEILEEATV